MKIENSDRSANGRLEDECVKPDSSVKSCYRVRPKVGNVKLRGEGHTRNCLWSPLEPKLTHLSFDWNSLISKSGSHFDTFPRVTRFFTLSHALSTKTTGLSCKSRKIHSLSSFKDKR
ncbi:hypothetical protein V6N13_019746 [Hibiscus sabdariffa]|uniref:Uncharacterized protein n=1 Tax=Hibiscus sabdariffa TaxID=183260 RepID=A0ABR2NRV4_9ROSI